MSATLATKKTNPTARQTAHFSQDLPTDLARVVNARPALPEAAKAAILAALGAAQSKC
jgi:hypothetical protein